MLNMTQDEYSQSEVIKELISCMLFIDDRLVQNNVSREDSDILYRNLWKMFTGIAHEKGDAVATLWAADGWKNSMDTQDDDEYDEYWTDD